MAGSYDLLFDAAASFFDRCTCTLGYSDALELHCLCKLARLDDLDLYNNGRHEVCFLQHSYVNDIRRRNFMRAGGVKG